MIKPAPRPENPTLLCYKGDALLVTNDLLLDRVHDISLSGERLTLEKTTPIVSREQTFQFDWAVSGRTGV